MKNVILIIVIAIIAASCSNSSDSRKTQLKEVGIKYSGVNTYVSGVEPMGSMDSLEIEKLKLLFPKGKTILLETQHGLKTETSTLVLDPRDTLPRLQDRTYQLVTIDNIVYL